MFRNLLKNKVELTLGVQGEPCTKKLGSDWSVFEATQTLSS